MNSLIKEIKVDYVLIASIILSFIIIAASFINFAYSQANQMDSNRSNNNTNANSLNIQNIPAKKVHVGDIDIVYKVFGKGDPILLINGYSFTTPSRSSVSIYYICVLVVFLFPNERGRIVMAL